jgi:hypothetical protein
MNKCDVDIYGHPQEWLGKGDGVFAADGETRE